MKPPQSLQIVLPDVLYRASFLAAYVALSGREKIAGIYLGADGTEDLFYNRFPEYV